MWLEAIITQEDLVKVLKEFLPVKILLDPTQIDVEKDEKDEKVEKKIEKEVEKRKNDPDRSLKLFPATAVTLVPDEGIQITCPAEITWSIAGMSPTVKIDELSVMLLPRVVERNKGSVLEFGLEVREADFHSLPGFVDETIVKAINGALATKKPGWNFTETLTRTIPLANLFDPVEALKIEVQWGKTKIGADVLGMVLSFKLGFVRND